MRTALRCLHRWLGLTLGLALALAGLTGALLVLAKPLDRAVNASLHHVPPGGEQVRLEPIHQALRAAHPEAELVFRLPRQPGDALSVRVRAHDTKDVFFDPRTGARLGERAKDEGAFNLLFALHSNLLLGEPGKTLLFGLALAFVAAWVSGVCLWWPRRWRDGFSVQLGQSGRRAVFDLHRVGGAVAGLFILVIVASGAYMAYRPLSLGINALAGAPAPAVPKAAGPHGPRQDLDRLIVLAKTALPGGQISVVQLPAEPDKPIRIRSRLPDEVHPNGLSVVWLSADGRLLQSQRWDEAPPGSRAFQWMYPLHSGELGGTMLETLVLLSGLVLAGLGLSGIWLWTARRRTRPFFHQPAPSAPLEAASQPPLPVWSLPR